MYRKPRNKLSLEHKHRLNLTIVLKPKLVIQDTYTNPPWLQTEDSSQEASPKGRHQRETGRRSRRNTKKIVSWKEKLWMREKKFQTSSQIKKKITFAILLY